MKEKENYIPIGRQLPPAKLSSLSQSEVFAAVLRNAVGKVGEAAGAASHIFRRLGRTMETESFELSRLVPRVEVKLDLRTEKEKSRDGFPLPDKALQVLKDFSARNFYRLPRAFSKKDFPDADRRALPFHAMVFAPAIKFDFTAQKAVETIRDSHAGRFRLMSEAEAVAEVCKMTTYGEARVRKLAKRAARRRAEAGKPETDFAGLLAEAFVAYLFGKAKKRIGESVRLMLDEELIGRARAARIETGQLNPSVETAFLKDLRQAVKDYDEKKEGTDGR